MAEIQPTSKAELMAGIEREWAALNRTIGRLTEAQMTALHDAQGWAVKDHLINLTAWERSVVFFLQGKPRYEGLGVEEPVYRQGSDDAINAVIYQQHKDLPLAEALAQLRAVHEQLLGVLQPLSDEDLNRPYRHFLPDEPGRGERPTIRVVFANSSGHIAEHLPWIEALSR